MASVVTSKNLNTATTQEILQAVGQLQDRFTQSIKRLDQMSPVEQCTHVNEIEEPYEGHELLEIATILSGLQNRVSTTFTQEWKAIPNISHDELLIISGKLKTSESLLDSIRVNYVFAKDILELSKACQRIFKDKNSSNIDPEEVKPLQKRITELRSTGGMNMGNKTALEQMEAIIATTAMSSTNPSMPYIYYLPKNRAFPQFVPHPMKQAMPFFKTEQSKSFDFSSPDLELQGLVNAIKFVKTSTEISQERKDKFFKDILPLIQ